VAIGSADEGTGVISPRIRSTNAEDAIPPGSRVHWTCRNASGTSAFRFGCRIDDYWDKKCDPFGQVVCPVYSPASIRA